MQHFRSILSSYSPRFRSTRGLAFSRASARVAMPVPSLISSSTGGLSVTVLRCNELQPAAIRHVARIKMTVFRPFIISSLFDSIQGIGVDDLQHEGRTMDVKKSHGVLRTEKFQVLSILRVVLVPWGWFHSVIGRTGRANRNVP